MSPLVVDALAWLFVPAAPLAVALLCATPATRSVGAALVPFAPLPALFFSLAPPPYADIPWLLFGARLGLDELGRTFLLFTSLLWILDGAFARARLASDPLRWRYLVFHSLTLMGNLGVIIAADIISFYSFFSLMTFSAYGLIVHDTSPPARRAGRAYLVFAVLGEVLLLAGLYLTAESTFAMDLDEAQRKLAEIETAGVASALLFAGFGVKAGALGLHMWLPVAYGAAPAFGGAVLSGTLSKAGVLGWLRFLPLGYGFVSWAPAVMVLGFVAALFGVVLGLCQRETRVVLAYSSISQMGLILMIVGAGLYSPEHAPLAVASAGLFALHHSLAKGALFLSVDAARYAAHPLARAVVVVAALLPGLSLAGLPFTSGAVAKKALEDTLSDGGGSVGSTLETLVPLTSIGTFLLLAWFWRLLLRTAWRSPDRVALPVTAPWLLLTAASAATIFLVPWLGASHFAAKSVEPSSLASLSWPALVALAVVVLVKTVLAPLGARLPAVPPGDLLVLLAPLLRGITVVGRQVSTVLHDAISWWKRTALRGVRRARPGVVWVLDLDKRLGWPLGAGLALALLLLVYWLL